jgi:hypothetical protein
MLDFIRFRKIQTLNQSIIFDEIGIIYHLTYQ